MADINYVTKETLEHMRNELTQLKTAGRAEIALGYCRSKRKR